MVTRVTPHFRKPPSSDRTRKYHDAFFNFMVHLRRYTMVYLLFFSQYIYIYMDTIGWWLFVCKFMGFGNNQKKLPGNPVAALGALGRRVWRRQKKSGNIGSRCAPRLGRISQDHDHVFFYLGEYLVGGLVAINFIFPNIGNVIIPTDFHIFQRGGPTTNQISWDNILHWIIMG